MSVSGIKLYDMNGRVTNVRPSVDPNQSIDVPATEFNNAFKINGDTRGIDIEKLMKINYGINSSGQTTNARPSSLSSLENFGKQPVNASQANISYQSMADHYKNLIKGLKVSEPNYDELIKSKNFNIFNGTQGINVQTDGTNITKVSAINRTSDLLQTGISKTPVPIPDLAEITARAASVQGNDLEIPPVDTKPDTNKLTLDKSVAGAQDINQQNTGLFPTETVQPASSLSQVSSPDSLVNNPFSSSTINTGFTDDPVLNKLNQLLPPGFDATVVTGQNSEVTPTTAKLIATSQADLNVDLKNSTSFNENMAKLREGLAQQSVQSAQSQAMKVAAARDGQMPLSPFVPSAASHTSSVSSGGTSTNLNQTDVGANSTDKKSSGGGYLPLFRNTSGGNQQSGHHHHRQQHRPAKIFALA